MIRWRTPLIALATLLSAFAIIVPAATGRLSAQSGGTMYIEPGDQAVPPGSEFTVRIMQNAGVPSSGAQATLGFDPGFMQIVDVQPGEPYGGTDLIARGALGDVVAEANTTGVLSCIATFFLPGTGSVPAGDQEFLVLTFRAITPGVSPIAFLEDSCVQDGGIEANRWFGIMVDEQGGEIPVTVQNGQVRIEEGAVAPTPDAGAGTPAAGGTAAAGTTRTPAAAGTRTPTSGVLGGSERPDTGTASMALDPSSMTIERGAQFSFDVTQSVGVPVSAATVSLGFSKDVVELLSIEPGDDWQDATGAEASTLENAVAELSTIARNEELKNGMANTSMAVVATPLTTYLLGPARPALPPARRQICLLAT